MQDRGFRPDIDGFLKQLTEVIMPLNDDLVKECGYEFIKEEVRRLESKYSMPIDISGPVKESINTKGWVYILSNPCMPGLLKVGMTTTSPEMRAKEISSATGVPDKFLVEASYFSDDPRGDEARIHAALNDYRINSGREFFRCSLDVVDEICRSFCLCESKSTLEEVADNYSIICAAKPIQMNLHEWFEELCVTSVGCKTNALRLIFELGCERLDEISRDGISIIIEDGGPRGILTESHQSNLAYLEELHEKAMQTGIYGPRLPGGF
ncbi:GIY-YIG nuclease family protein [Jejubacter sp. L23]